MACLFWRPGMEIYVETGITKAVTTQPTNAIKDLNLIVKLNFTVFLFPCCPYFLRPLPTSEFMAEGTKPSGPRGVGWYSVIRREGRVHCLQDDWGMNRGFAEHLGTFYWLWEERPSHSASAILFRYKLNM